jgi:hypothetical protein
MTKTPEPEILRPPINQMAKMSRELHTDQSRLAASLEIPAVQLIMSLVTIYGFESNPL